MATNPSSSPSLSSDPYITEIVYEIEPAPASETLCSIPAMLFLLGCVFPPFWLIGTGFLVKSEPESLTRAYAIICLFLSFIFLSFFITVLVNALLNPEKSAVFLKDLVTWQ
ncbi:hypothetical protein K502DRAFT_330839 [Neoconidiobolus thromboides FSU 785]|nr:hypothetical protein K502DRAFT_330839 [Neoconidiobolus thromboides FSU 785]